MYLRDSLLRCLFCLNFVSTSVLVANCTLLHKLSMLNISFGCCRHSVFNTSAQLTEGRSARDQPKQLPAKKKLSRLPVFYGFDCKFLRTKMVWFTKLTVLFFLECGWVGGVCWVVVFLGSRNFHVRTLYVQYFPCFVERVLEM